MCCANCEIQLFISVDKNWLPCISGYLAFNYITVNLAPFCLLIGRIHFSFLFWKIMQTTDANFGHFIYFEYPTHRSSWCGCCAIFYYCVIFYYFIASHKHPIRISCAIFPAVYLWFANLEIWKSFIVPYNLLLCLQHNRPLSWGIYACAQPWVNSCSQANTSGNELSSTLMNTGASQRSPPRPQDQVTVHAWLFNQTQQQPYNHNGWKTHSMAMQMAWKLNIKPNLQKPLRIFAPYGVRDVWDEYQFRGC